MEFGEKLQILRKQRALTQEELAQALYVSRAAVSKWESGRGYPGVDSLRAIAAFFSVSVDELLSGEQLLHLAEVDTKTREERICDLLFGAVDLGALLYLLLPLFAQKGDEGAQAVSLLQWGTEAIYLKAACLIFVAASALLGLVTLLLRNTRQGIWQRSKRQLSLLLHGAGLLLFILMSHPYAALCLFLCFGFKVLLLGKRQ